MEGKYHIWVILAALWSNYLRNELYLCTVIRYLTFVAIDL